MQKKEIIDNIINENFTLKNGSITALNDSFENSIRYHFNKTRLEASNFQDFKSSLIYSLFLDLNNKEKNELEELALTKSFLKRAYVKMEKEAFKHNRTHLNYITYRSSLNNKTYLIFLDKVNDFENVVLKDNTEVEEEEVLKDNTLENWLIANKNTVLTLRQQSFLEYFPLFLNFENNKLDYKNFKKMLLDKKNIKLSKHHTAKRSFYAIRENILRKFINEKTEAFTTVHIRKYILKIENFIKALEDKELYFEALDILKEDFNADMFITDILENDKFLKQEIKTRMIQNGKGKDALTVNDLYYIKLTLQDSLEDLRKELKCLNLKNQEFLAYLRNVENRYDLSVQNNFKIPFGYEGSVLKINKNGINTNNQVNV